MLGLDRRRQCFPPLSSFRRFMSGRSQTYYSVLARPAFGFAFVFTQAIPSHHSHESVVNIFLILFGLQGDWAHKTKDPEMMLFQSIIVLLSVALPIGYSPFGFYHTSS